MHMLLFALLCLVSLVSGRFQHQTVSQNIASLRNFFNEKRNINKKTNVESGTIDISFANNNQDYSIIVNKKEWLVSGLTSFRSNNNWVNLTLNSTESHKGNDNFGEYNDITLFWHDIDNTDSVMATGFRTYPNKPDIIILSQTFPNGTVCDIQYISISLYNLVAMKTKNRNTRNVPFFSNCCVPFFACSHQGNTTVCFFCMHA